MLSTTPLLTSSQVTIEMFWILQKKKDDMYQIKYSTCFFWTLLYFSPHVAKCQEDYHYYIFLLICISLSLSFYPLIFFYQLHFVSLPSFLQIPSFWVLFAAVRCLFFYIVLFVFILLRSLWKILMLILDEFYLNLPLEIYQKGS